MQGLVDERSRYACLGGACPKEVGFAWLPQDSSQIPLALENKLLNLQCIIKEVAIFRVMQVKVPSGCKTAASHLIDHLSPIFRNRLNGTVAQHDSSF